MPEDVVPSSATVPMVSPAGYTPPKPEVRTVSPSLSSASESR